MSDREVARLTARVAKLEAALRECVYLICSACPDASYWTDTLADQVDAALDGEEPGPAHGRHVPPETSEGES